MLLRNKHRTSVQIQAVWRDSRVIIKKFVTKKDVLDKIIDKRMFQEPNEYNSTFKVHRSQNFNQ